MVLGAGQGFTISDAQLPFDKVLAADHFGDWVFYLEAGVHLHKEEFAAAVE